MHLEPWHYVVAAALTAMVVIPWALIWHTRRMRKRGE